ncbi:MAG: SDR family oxidoreductase, partial [Gemmatimonadales bacterium]
MAESMAGVLVLVTGASRGIGAATAQRMHQAGARLVRIARSTMPPLSNSLDINADLSDPATRQAALAKVSEVAGVPDVVVSNAGSFLLAPLAETGDPLVREQIAINVEAPIAVARHFLPAMRERGSGLHIIVGSVADWRGFTGNAAYAASKYAVRGLHEVLLEEYRSARVRCTLVSPGPTDTAAWDSLDPDHRPDLPSRSDMLRPSDVADVICFVATRPPHVQLELIRLGP